MAVRQPKTQQYRQDQQIVLALLNGSTQAEAAARHGVSERTVRRALKRWKESRPKSLDLSDPLEQLADQLHFLQVAKEDLAEIRCDPASSERTTIAAIAAQLKVQREHTDLMIATGLLPSAGDEDMPLERFSASFFQWCRRRGSADESPPLPPEVIEFLHHLLEDWSAAEKRRS